ncbi:hypothetical protein P3S68_006314 [Capsicum galapagoense]
MYKNGALASCCNKESCLQIIKTVGYIRTGKLLVANMAATFIRLFLAFLWFSHAINLINAVPLTRSTRLVMDVSQEHKVLENTHMANMEDEEINDYPGSGANNRHTPRPQLGRGCVVEC